ncbi:VOC family protein [Streptomyces katrae]|uniref:VOC family protein n=1 Tax=Streptomyces katrae TaxID=68223 RepID=A0ABT7GVP3_9ACTN|nr:MULTISPECIES: VOC family protein [Streptomyces]MDK9497309.1 VOC family protein [Streptomyces katrae]RST02635.1 VOC family protein [Streptomyces sp. WAC07149]
MTEASGASRRTPGTPCWVSLMVHGLGSTEDFYADLFGWEYEPGPTQFGPSVRAFLDGQEVAGIGEMPPDRHLPVAWTPYFATDDADCTAESIRSCGGTVAVGPLDAGAAGRMAICSDPLGAIFGIWQTDGHPAARRAGAAGTPVWNELLTQESSTVGKFYEHVFGHDAEPHPDVPSDFDYLTLRLGGRPVAAVHGVGRSLPHDRGPHWMTYFEVADPDAAAARVAGLGGRVVTPPRERITGRLAVVADPEGAVFALVRTPPAT